MQPVFKHTLKIPGNHSRQEVWAALLTLIQNPKRFVEALTRVEVEEVSSDNNQKVFSRKMDFGNFEFCDSVVCDKEQTITIYIPASANVAESKNVISLNECSDGQFELLFEYFEDTSHPAVVSSKPYSELRYNAWKAKDLLFCKELLKELAQK